jgi:alkanesulfonate monooxygenase SsuD/methylene tetrahydromethanopterin reductase-like flavin-dependent oxidoreductase (luciferase family)
MSAKRENQLKFGLSMTGMLQQPPGTDMVATLGEAVELVKLANELGFAYMYAGQHYLSHPYQMLQPLPVMGRLAAEAPGMDQVSTAVLPLHNPVDLAEQVASLDVITNGHAILAVALGYREEEYESFGVKREDRVSRMIESLEVMQLLWSGEKVSYKGKHFQLSDVHIGLNPVQRPSPPVWIAASSDRAVERAGRLGYPWLINHADYPTVERQVAMYRAALHEAGHSSVTTLPALREFFVAETREEAIRACQPFLSGKYETYSQWGQDEALNGEQSFTSDFEELARDRFIVGSVEDVVTDLKRYEALGVTHMGLRMRWAGMGVEPTAKCMRLVAEQVMPHFQ